MPKPELYRALAAYNRAMNARVYEVCAGIPDAARRADRGAFFKSIHGTLNHLLYGDRALMNRLAGTAFDLAPVGEDLYESFDDARAHSALVGLVDETKPAAVVDCINTATAISYQDVPTASKQLMADMGLRGSGDPPSEEQLQEALGFGVLGHAPRIAPVCISCPLRDLRKLP